jgi:hypothetical protein
LNSNKHHYLACSGFELYGVLTLPPELHALAASAFTASSPSSAASSSAASASSASGFLPLASSSSAASASLPLPSAPAPAPVPSPVSGEMRDAKSDGASASAAASASAQRSTAVGVGGCGLNWLSHNHGSFLQLCSVSGARNVTVENTGSDSKWMMVRSERELSSSAGGRHLCCVKVTADKPTTNTCMCCVVGKGRCLSCGVVCVD